MSLSLDLQIASGEAALPDEQAFTGWAEAVLKGRRERTEITIRLVDEAEGRALNRDFRGSDKATNVLSFPYQAPEVVASDLLGDLVICAPVVAAEARAQGKAPMAHWAHMVVHGLLHLLGYDHQGEAEAGEMEGIESALMSQLGFPDPYQEQA
jgi:probable rRNA maturation factor